MTRLRIGWCCAVACLSWPCAIAKQQQDNPMPAAAAGIVGQMDKEILVAKKKAVEGLEKVLRDTTKKGDLAGAMAVKQTVDRLKGEISAIGPNKGGRGHADILGRWQGSGWSLEFFPNGTVTSPDKSLTGTWVMTGETVDVTFTNGISHSVERTADGWAGFYKQGGKTGGAVRYTRLP